MKNQSIILNSEMNRLLQVLDLTKQKSIDTLAEELDLPRAKVELLMYQLHKKDLVDFQVQNVLKVVLTTEGNDVLKNGLPENLILRYLKKKNVNTSLIEISKDLELSKPALNAAIGQLRKKGIINIEKGMVQLIKEVDKLNENLEICIKSLSIDPLILPSDEDVDILTKRKLIELKERQQTLVNLSANGLKMKDTVRIKENISKLTPEDIRNGNWRNLELKHYKVTTEAKSIPFGKKHPYLTFLEDVKRILIGLGFSEMRGPLVETEFWNFDALFQAQDHPAREWSDVYTIKDPKSKNSILHGTLPKDKSLVDAVKRVHESGEPIKSRGWRYRWDSNKASQLLLRPQGTSVSARTLYKLEIPSKWFSIARCYRPDSVDATHLSEFNQLEGIVCDPSITFRDLLGILKTFAETVAGATEVRFKPDYYPFTSPSVELSAKHPKLGYIEFGGAGIFRPEVTVPFNISDPVIAWGLGVDRLYMVNRGINDIRELFSQNLEWLRTVPLV